MVTCCYFSFDQKIKNNGITSNFFSVVFVNKCYLSLYFNTLWEQLLSFFPEGSLLKFYQNFSPSLCFALARNIVLTSIFLQLFLLFKFPHFFSFFQMSMPSLHKKLKFGKRLKVSYQSHRKSITSQSRNYLVLKSSIGL